MKKVGVLLFAFMFLFCMTVLPVLAADTSKDVEQLKGEVQKLLKRIDEIEKKQAETVTKVAEAEKKVEKVEKKSLKDRIEFGGEARFRIMTENASTEKGFYGFGKPSTDSKFRDESSFPLRIRLNAHAEVVEDWVDFYARLTLNKRWGAYDTTANDPFNKPNSFESSIGHDLTAKFEQAYMTMNLPWINGKWYIGRLPGMDGAPQRQARTLFPRLFMDSEIDGTLISINAPETPLDNLSLPWTSTRLFGKQSEPGKAPTLKTYESKVKDKTGIILGYLKYDEKKMANTSTEIKTTKADADAFLAQAQIKLGKDTEIIWDGLVMDDWHMPQTSVASNVKVDDNSTNYVLTGAYADTQLFGFQLYGAYYYSHFKVPEHNFKTTTTSASGSTTTTTKVESQGFPGHIWFAGFNTGDLINRDHQLTVEFADGSDAWINPFNYRGFRRKGTVLQPQGNYAYDSTGNSTVGFYPFNAQVWDIYYDYYFKPSVRFRLGYMDFMYTKHDKGSILGSSKFQHDTWPYFEVNLSF